MKFRLNIIPKLTLIFVLFATLLLATVSVLSYNNGRAALQTAVVSELLSTAIDKQTALDAWIGEAKVHAAAIASSPSLQERLADFQEAQRGGKAVEARAAHDRLVAELQIWAGEGKDYQEWMIMDQDSGQVIAATDANEEGRFREDQAFFINGKSDSYIQNVYYSPSTQSMLMTVSSPILSSAGGLVGVLAGNLDLEKMNKIISRRTGLRQSDEAFLVNTSELFVTQPRLFSDPAVLRLGVHIAAVKLCLARNSGVITTDDYRGIPAMIVYRWLPERQLCLIVKMDRAEALEPAQALRNDIMIISSLALVAAAGLAWWLARTITRPIHQLAKGAAEIGGGNLEYRIAMAATDEIGQLAGEFNLMAGSIEDMQTQLGQRAQQLEAANRQLESELAERKRAEEALRESEERIRRLSEAAFEAIIIHDGGILLSANNQYSEMFGYEPEELLGKQVMSLTIAPDAIEAVKKEITTGGVGPYESTGLKKDGTRFPMEIRVREVEYKGRKVRVAAIMDITERKRAEETLHQRAAQLEAANKELEAFSYSISHDLRAPLRAMDGFSRIVLEENASQLTAEAQRYLGLVRDGAQQMGHLIEDLLAFSRLSQLPLNKQTVAPAEIVQKSLAGLRAGQEQRNVEITIGDLPACEADPALLTQVWVNLLDNALKFTRKREAACIEVGFLPHSTPAGAVPGVGMDEVDTYFVRDNGVGFDMQYADKLFGVFQRLHRAEEYEGTGVGLAIVQRIVHRHGGRVWAEAEVDKGATFYFSLEGGIS